MKVVLYMAMSANGIIARETGTEDFLSHTNWETFSDLVGEYGNFIVGQKTYEAVKNWDEEYGFDDFTQAVRIVVSDNPSFQVKEGYILATSPQDALEKLKEKGIDTALLTGGSTLNNSFANEELLDEIILNVEPVVIGEGIPLFKRGQLELQLKLIETKEISDGIIQLHYQVLK